VETVTIPEPDEEVGVSPELHNTHAQSAEADVARARRHQSVAARILGLAKREGYPVSFTGSHVAVGVKSKGENIVSQRYSCLPDTVDPRGPKGK
jgi:hypothetical protein